MDHNVTVESLGLGDKFEFLTSRAEGARPEVMVVTREPVVNPAADSCHFRYRPEAAPIEDGRWSENQSWNGSQGVKVRLVETSPTAAPVEAAQDSPTPTKRKPATAAVRRKRATED